jgi:hypothetical protein
METFTLVMWLYAGGLRHDTTYILTLDEGVCKALAEQVERRAGMSAWCRRREPVCAHGGGSCAWPLLPGRRRI